MVLCQYHTVGPLAYGKFTQKLKKGRRKNEGDAEEETKEKVQV